MKKLLFVGLLLALTLVAVDDIPGEIGSLIESYRTALYEKSMEPIEGKLAMDFDFSGAGSQFSPMVLEQIVTTGVYQIREISEIELEELDGFTRVYVHGEIVAMGQTAEGTDIMDIVEENGEWKILALGSGVAQPMVIQDPTTDLHFGLEGPDFVSIPFMPETEHIIVQAKLKDGTDVNFVVDNGTPISIIDAGSANLFGSDTPMAAATQALGAGGEIENTGAVMIDYLRVGELEIENLTAITMDISHLSEALEIDITGLLGTEFLSKFAWTLDYSGRRLMLHRLDSEGNAVSTGPADPVLSREPAHVIAFDRTMHLLTTVAQFSPTVTADVVLDCGAGAGVIVPELFERIQETAYEMGDKDTLMGADKIKRDVQTIILKNLTIGPESRGDYPTAVSDLSHLNVEGLGMRIDAIIGYNFFSDWLITTWYNKNIIELRPIPK
ncbi:MAG: aspartyl protease family protein [bacterium]